MHWLRATNVWLNLLRGLCFYLALPEFGQSTLRSCWLKQGWILFPLIGLPKLFPRVNGLCSLTKSTAGVRLRVSNSTWVVEATNSFFILVPSCASALVLRNGLSSETLNSSFSTMLTPQAGHVLHNGHFQPDVTCGKNGEKRYHFGI